MHPPIRKAFRIATAITLMLPLASIVRAADTPTPLQIVTTMVSNEKAANQNRNHFFYISYEKSDRTGGHLWTERNAEVKQGRIRYLIEEDGKPLSPDRKAAEIARLKDIIANPDDFVRKEKERLKNEIRANQMVDMLPRAFLFQFDGTESEDNVTYTRIRFTPNPDYKPQGIEEKLMHAMEGSILIEPRQLRLRQLDSNLPHDISIGFGMLATVHAGTKFHTVRAQVSPTDWKNIAADTHIDCRAILFKNINRDSQSEHKAFKELPQNMSIAEAVDLLTK